MKYYTSLSYMAKKYDSQKREYAFQAGSVEEFESWKESTRRRLVEIAGMPQCIKVSPESKLIKTEQTLKYTREYWVIKTEPEVWMPFYFFKPKEYVNGGTMIVPHGHGPGKEAVVGNRNYEGAVLDWKQQIEFAISLVEEGYYVICPDARGSGERREFLQQGNTKEDWLSNSHRELLQVAIGFGQSLVGLFVWDLMRLLDFLSEQPEIDSMRIGCAGMSGGGQQALWLSMLDDRIKLTVTSGYFYGMKESLLQLCQNCACNYVPFLWNTVDMGDMGALLAPRPLLIETGKEDPLNGESGLNNVVSQYEVTKKAYQLFQAEDRLRHSIHEGGHVWNGKDVLPFIKKWL